MMQQMIGLGGGKASGHGEGAATILKAKGIRYDPDDEFEGLLLQTLRGPLVWIICRGRFLQDNLWLTRVSSYSKASSTPKFNSRTMSGTP